jgi:intraflagellar transport protein 172
MLCILLWLLPFLLQMTSYDIKGDVEDIERGNGKTEVIVDEGITTASYMLDEGLIAFSTAIDDADLGGALSILEGLELTPETTAMWQQLGELAMAGSGDLHVAERCAVAQGDIARARFLHKTLKIASLAAQRLGGDGRDFWMVRARLCELRRDTLAAEAIFVEQGKLDDAIEMYQTLQMWDDAIALAESHGHRDAATMRSQYAQYLLASGQEERAGALKEHEGDIAGAIALYLRGGYPAKALALVTSSPASYPKDTLERLVTALSTAGMYEKVSARVL